MKNINLKKVEEAFRQKAQQRKEDNRIFLENNLKNLSEAEVQGETIIDESSVTSYTGYYSLEESIYHHTKFKDLLLGTENAATESEFVTIAGVRFNYCDFSGCGFSNIQFIDCLFVGCNINECYTLGNGVNFLHCCFMRTTPGKNSIDDMPSIFSGSELMVKFINCDLTQVLVENTHFYFSLFENVNANDMIFIDTNFDTFTLCDCDLRNTSIINPKFIEFYVEDKNKRTKVNSKTFLGNIDFNKKEEREVRFAMEVYTSFSELFESNKVSFLSGEYYYQNKMAEFNILKGMDKIKSFFGLITCGYGERPSFSLITSVILIILCGTLYMFCGINYSNADHYFIFSYDYALICYHFSLVTFTSTGYGNVTPLGGSMYVSALEMISGVIMIGIWVSTLVRKMVK